MNPRAQVLTDEFTLKRTFVDALDQVCADENRDLSDDERTQYDTALTRMENISADLEKINKRAETFDAVAAVTATVQAAAPARTNERLPSLGEYVKTRAMHSLGKVSDDEMETLQRVVAHGVSTDGTSPTTIEGDLVNFVDARRPAVNAVRRIAMPDNRASTFNRPRVSQHTTIGRQVAEGDVLSSQRLKTTLDSVQKYTYGGTVALSEQEIDWTEPSLLGLTTQDLAQQYAITTDDLLCSAIESISRPGATPPTGVSLTATPAVFIAAVIDSMSDVYEDSKRLPDTLFLAPDRWAYIAGLTDTDGRPVFAPVNPMNAFGTNSGFTSFEGLAIAGLKVVVDPNLTAGYWGTAASELVEFYEQDKGLLSIQAPSTLETIIAYRGYVAVFVHPEGVRALEA